MGLIKSPCFAIEEICNGLFSFSLGIYRCAPGRLKIRSRKCVKKDPIRWQPWEVSGLKKYIAATFVFGIQGSGHVTGNMRIKLNNHIRLYSVFMGQCYKIYYKLKLNYQMLGPGIFYFNPKRIWGRQMWLPKLWTIKTWIFFIQPMLKNLAKTHKMYQ